MTKEASRIHLSFLLAGKEDFREMKKATCPMRMCACIVYTRGISMAIIDAYGGPWVWVG